MKISFTFDIFSIQRMGGITRYFREVQSRLGKSCKVSTFAGFHRSSEAETMHATGVQVAPIAGTLTCRAAVNSFWQAIVFSRWKPDIIHQTYYYPVLRKNGAKIVITVYDLIQEEIPGGFSPVDLTKVLKARAIRNADAIICISNETERKLRLHYPVKDKIIRVIKLGSQFSTEAAIPRKRQSLILHVGSRDVYKNFDFLI